jgi:hypothetical protein
LIFAAIECKKFLQTHSHKKPRSMTGLFRQRLFSGSRGDLGEKFRLRSLGCRGFDLADLHWIFAKSRLILSLAAPYAVVEGKFSAIVFDIRISHIFAPSQQIDTGKTRFA